MRGSPARHEDVPASAYILPAYGDTSLHRRSCAASRTRLPGNHRRQRETSCSMCQAYKARQSRGLMRRQISRAIPTSFILHLGSSAAGTRISSRFDRTVLIRHKSLCVPGERTNLRAVKIFLSRLFTLFTLSIRRLYVHIVAAKTEFSRTNCASLSSDCCLRCPTFPITPPTALALTYSL